MKGSGRVFLSVLMLTMLMVGYVHFQVSSFVVSYDIYALNEEFESKDKIHKQLKFEVNQLKAPNYLKQQMDEKDLSLTLPKAIKTIEVPIPETYAPVIEPQKEIPPFNSGIFGFLGQWVKVAQAKTNH